MRPSFLFAFGLWLTTAAGVYQGFNYGSTQSDGSYKQQSDFQAEFQTAKSLVGTSGGFTSARLYTMIQGGTTNTPTSAIPAAIAEDTSLLLGLWASSGETDITDEIAALQSAITTYGDSFTKLVAGISVGSEDLYRNSVTGIESDAGVGADPDAIVSYISQVRSAISGTGLSSVPVGHVDTWTAWVNSSNDAVIDASDWIGMDAYPYFQNTMANSIEDGQSLFSSALSQTQAAVGSKPVWITETGWPVSGSTENLAVPSTANAETYWDDVGCGLLFGKINTWWFTLQDADPTTPNPSFGVVGSELSDTPLYDLACSASSSSVSSSSTTATSVTSSLSSTATATEITSSAVSGSSSGTSTTITSSSTGTSFVSSVPSSGIAGSTSTSFGVSGASSAVSPSSSVPAASGSAPASSFVSASASTAPRNSSSTASSGSSLTLGISSGLASSTASPTSTFSAASTGRPSYLFGSIVTLIVAIGALIPLF